ncbi:MAG: hypothetical protein RDV48_23385 [Candidatus Eremiobacteraeota bacterium]|nr:hypothetical protein [Candidatus Eremiobacteraeota bacterium]
MNRKEIEARAKKSIAAGFYFFCISVLILFISAFYVSDDNKTDTNAIFFLVAAVLFAIGMVKIALGIRGMRLSLDMSLQGRDAKKVPAREASRGLIESDEEFPPAEKAPLAEEEKKKPAPAGKVPAGERTREMKTLDAEKIKAGDHKAEKPPEAPAEKRERYVPKPRPPVQAAAKDQEDEEISVPYLKRESKRPPGAPGEAPQAPSPPEGAEGAGSEGEFVRAPFPEGPPLEVTTEDILKRFKEKLESLATQ